MCAVNAQAVAPRFPTTYVTQELLFSSLHTLAFLETAFADRCQAMILIHTGKHDYFDSSDLSVRREETDTRAFLWDTGFDSSASTFAPTARVQPSVRLTLRPRGL